ncbi:hypothetical protein OF001_U330016 [Pseudomonas sp. OF001]|nr:hypothetical protein OF001_U330016 [Pseudomonas sp. OF001]
MNTIELQSIVFILWGEGHVCDIPPGRNASGKAVWGRELTPLALCGAISQVPLVLHHHRVCSR